VESEAEPVLCHCAQKRPLLQSDARVHQTKVARTDLHIRLNACMYQRRMLGWSLRTWNGNDGLENGCSAQALLGRACHGVDKSGRLPAEVLLPVQLATEVEDRPRPASVQQQCCRIRVLLAWEIAAQNTAHLQRQPAERADPEF